MLPQGAIPTADYFEQEISYLFANLDFIKVCLDNVLIYSYSDEKDYLEKLQIVLNWLYDSTLKAKVSKYIFFCKRKYRTLAIILVIRELALNGIKWMLLLI